MPKKEPYSKTEYLAGYQILGGLVGLGLTIYLLTNLSSFPIELLTLILIAFCLYGYSVFCGAIIFRNPLLGLRLSLINQILQVFSFSIAGYTFEYVSGVYFSLGFDVTSTFTLRLFFGLSTWRIALNQDSEINIIGFNVVALILIIFISRQITRIKNEMVEDQLNEIQ